jgi:hypothetical protein
MTKPAIDFSVNDLHLLLDTVSDGRPVDAPTARKLKRLAKKAHERAEHRSALRMLDAVRLLIREIVDDEYVQEARQAMVRSARVLCMRVQGG